MKTTVYLKKSRLDQAGQRLPNTLLETEEKVSPGLAARLLRYARGRLTDAGFSQAAGWEAEVYSLDADSRPRDRSYVVRFQNDRGGYVEVIGILTSSGWPCMDHGLAVGEENFAVSRRLAHEESHD